MRSTEQQNLARQIQQAQQDAEWHRMEEEETLRHLIEYREQEPKSLDEKIAAVREEAQQRIVADERKIADLMRRRQIARLR